MFSSALAWKSFELRISLLIFSYRRFAQLVAVVDFEVCLLTCSSFLSLSFRFELRSSWVIFCWSFSMSSAFACSSGLNVVELSADVSFPISSTFVGTVTNPRAPRLRSFSRMSMKFCENLWRNERISVNLWSTWGKFLCISWINWIRIRSPRTASNCRKPKKIPKKSETNWKLSGRDEETT